MDEYVDSLSVTSLSVAPGQNSAQGTLKKGTPEQVKVSSAEDVNHAYGKFVGYANSA
jgi:hypothetical protein